MNTDCKFGMFIRGKDNGHDTFVLAKSILQNILRLLSNICCWNALELPVQYDVKPFAWYTPENVNVFGNVGYS